MGGLFEFARRVGILAYLSMFGLIVRIEIGDNPVMNPPHIVAIEALRMLSGAPHQFWMEDMT